MKKTSSKIIFVSNSTDFDDRKEILSKHFDLNDLEKDFGGERDSTWNTENYFNPIIEEEK